MSPRLSCVHVLLLLIAGLHHLARSQDCDDDFEDGVDPATASFVGYPGTSCGEGTDRTCYTAASGREKPALGRFDFGDTLRCEAGYCAEVDGGLGALCDNGGTCRPGYTECMPAQDGRDRCMGIGRVGEEICFDETQNMWRIAVFGCTGENECKQYMSRSGPIGSFSCYSKDGLPKGSECNDNPDLCAPGLICHFFDDSSGGQFRCAEEVKAGSPCGQGLSNLCDSPGRQDSPTCREGICRNGLGHPCDNGEVCDDGLTCVEYDSTDLNTPTKQKLCSDLNGDVGERCKFGTILDTFETFDVRTCREGLVCKVQPRNSPCPKWCNPEYLCELP